MRVRASTEPAAVAGADVVLFCVKSGDTEDAGRAIGPHLAPGALVLGLQNGVDNAERLRRVIDREVAATVVYVATEMAGPGHVRHHGRGELVVEPCTRSADVVAAFAAAGVPVTVSADVQAALWVKLVINCAYNALSAIAQLPYGRVVEVDGIAGVMADVVAECRAVAAAESVALPETLGATVAGLAATMPGQYSSTAQDLARGRPTEIEHLNGHVVRRGAARGVPTPVNATLLALVRLAEHAAALRRA
jgi:2-dehydropantoate 2-reductase